MTKNEHEAESRMLDLGAASVETKGGAPYQVQDNLISSRKDTPQAAD